MAAMGGTLALDDFLSDLTPEERTEVSPHEGGLYEAAAMADRNPMMAG